MSEYKKHSVSTDALDTLGSIINESQGRDAIHLAVEPVVASERLLAGQDVCILPDGRAAKGKENAVGIVDPFLKQSVKAGERFWLVVYPRQITSLRHVWTHPAFDSQPVVSEADREQAKRVAERLTGESERWLREFCRTGDCPDYEALMEAIKKGSHSTGSDEDYSGYSITIGEESISVGGQDAHGTIPPEFWDHVENVTGVKQTMRPEYFSCSC